MDSNIIKFEDASKMSGWLMKQSPGIFKNYQKRFFLILNGRYLVYKEKEQSEVKGTIDLKQAIIDENLKKEKGFLITFGDRKFKLKANTKDMKFKWINSMLSIKDHLNPFQEIKAREHLNNKELKKEKHKLYNLESDAFTVLEKAGMVFNQDEEEYKKRFFGQEIFNNINNLSKSLQDSRIISGFLYKRHKSRIEIFQKRWCFLISPRPLTSENKNDDIQLDDKILFNNFSFDNLFYYKFDNHSFDFRGKIPLSECFGVEIKEEETRYLITIDLGGRKIVFYTEIKGERDKWYEGIKLSRKTAKDFKRSFTKKPRNLNKLSNIIMNEGVSAIREICEKEKKDCLGDCNNLQSLDILETKMKILQNFLLETIDGCILFKEPKIDIIKVYVDSFNLELLLKVNSFWKGSYDHISNGEIISLGSLLYDQSEQLNKFGVTDHNLSQNGKELFKIFAKKIFSYYKDQVFDIMTFEREIKAYKSFDQILITKAPYDLKKLFYDTLDLIKNRNSKYLLSNLLSIIKETIMIYLIGNDYIINRNDLNIDKEFLLAINNNCSTLKDLIVNLIDEIKNLNILSLIEINEQIKFDELCGCLEVVSNTAILRFINDLYDLIIQEFNLQFIKVDVEKILKITFDVYMKFVNFIKPVGKSQFWKEVLNGTLFYYIKSLFISDHNKSKILNDITNKVKSDKINFITAFENYIDKDIVIESLKIMDDFIDFLETSTDMMVYSCMKLRQQHGSNFSLSTAKALINLRVDLTSDQKKDAIDSCNEFLEKFQKTEKLNNKQKNKLLDLIDEEMKEFEQRELEEKIQESNLEEFSTVYNRKTIQLSEHLKFQLEEEEDDDKIEDTNKEKFDSVYSRKPLEENEKDTDEIMSGYMQKKTYLNYQQRYFCLKNGYLFWFKEEKSRKARNFIWLMEDIKIGSKKPDRFFIILKEQVYKFICESSEIKEKWVDSIKSEMKKLKIESEKKIENIYLVKVKKKIINEMTLLPKIFIDLNDIKDSINKCLSIENCFLKKEKFIKQKLDLEPKKDILDQRPEFSVKIDRRQTVFDNSLLESSKKPIESLNLTQLKRKPRSYFSFCNKFLMCFKRKKAYDEYLVTPK